MKQGDRVMDVSRKFYGDIGTVLNVGGEFANVQWDETPKSGSYWATSPLSTLKQLED